VGGYFQEQLESLRSRHDCVIDVRGMGLMLGMELDSAELAAQVAAQLMDRHIIINRTSETVLRFLPPYILERGHVDSAIRALDEVLTSLTSNIAAMAGRALAGENSHG
jgi:acetylornithine/N-succinyldiaminopimelate aminotransferase